MTKILIIEDNKANLELMVYLFKLFGYATIIAMDGEEAITLTRQELPDLIVCDIQLPKLNGYELVKILKKDSQLQHIPIIAVTAYAMAGDRDKIRTAGFDAYIAKPINPAQFVHQVEVLLPEQLRSTVQLSMPLEIKNSALTNQSDKRLYALIVDNFLANRELFKNLLESINFEVTAVRNATEAIDVIQKKLPDLILSDLHLPDMSSLEFLKLLQKDEQWKSIPFVIMSANRPSDNTMIEIKKSLAKRFILLPIDSEAFLRIIKNICLPIYS